jgi:hypothetical protein
MKGHPMSRISRKQWGARRRRHHPGRLEPADVLGIALHWPAMEGRCPRTTLAVMALLRAWQTLHMDHPDRGWSDIAYQEAFDQLGNVYVLRGLKNRPAANGTTTTNGTHGALLLILGPGEQPSTEMIAAVRRRIARHREIFPNSRRIVGHGDLKATTCPGPIVRDLIADGVFEPTGASR